ncbi:hypothetical protein YC2023_108731 [Brassica napus]
MDQLRWPRDHGGTDLRPVVVGNVRLRLERLSLPLLMLSISQIRYVTDVVTARSPGVRPGLSKGRYRHVSTHLDNPTCPVTVLRTGKNGNGGVSNKLLSEVVLDQPARMTLYTTLCGN